MLVNIEVGLWVRIKVDGRRARSAYMHRLVEVVEQLEVEFRTALEAKVPLAPGVIRHHESSVTRDLHDRYGMDDD